MKKRKTDPQLTFHFLKHGPIPINANTKKLVDSMAKRDYKTFWKEYHKLKEQYKNINK